MNEIAITILMFLSSILGIKDYPDNSQKWEIIKTWQKTTDGYYYFSAKNNDIARECINNPSNYIEFPSIIHSSSQLKINNQIIASTGSPDFKHIRGFYGALIVPCYQIREDKNLIWEVVSYSKYFARFHYFPRVVEKYPKANFFNETLNIGGATVLLTLCVLCLVLFTGKISKEKLISLICSNFFTSIYFIFNSAESFGLSFSMLSAHKIADSGLWIGFLFFMHTLYLEGLILRWMNIVYRLLIIISLTIICVATTGDSIQFGTSIPFLFTTVFPGYAIIGLIKKGKLKSKKDSIQLIALLISFLVYFNDVFVVMGAINSFPFLPLGIAASYIFILLSVNDQLKILTNQLKETNDNLTRTQNELIKSEKMAAMGRTVARIAHELNTPIYLVRSSVQNIKTQTDKFLKSLKSDDWQNILLKTKQYEDDLNKMTKSLMASAYKAAELVKNFKEISIDQINVKKKDFLLIDYIRKSLVTIEDELIRKKIKVNLKGDEILINNDPGLFYQIIQNLITNAQKYAYGVGGGVVDIEVVNLGDRFKIIFCDYGKGIDKESLSKIFDAFFTTGGGSGGVGLGLNIVYKIVTEKLKGQIDCKSSKNIGTTFTITIPSFISNVDN